MTANRLQVVIRADASRVMGTGHIMRCLTLARTLRTDGAEIIFVCREQDGDLCAFIEAAGFAVMCLPRASASPADRVDGPAHAAWLGVSSAQDASDTIAAIGGRVVDWLIVDHYGLDASWERQLRPLVKRIAVIDDLADREHDCDLVLDQNFSTQGTHRYNGLVPATAATLLGPAFALLAPEYAQLRKRVAARSGPVRRILVSFGGADHLGLSLRTVQALLSLPSGSVKADIVLSQASLDFAAIRELLDGQPDFVLHDRVPSLAPMMLAADLAIGAGGATHWERMCLGLPALVVTMADNQTAIAAQLAEQGLIKWLGNAQTVTADLIADEVRQLLEKGLDGQWSERCFGLVDGLGARRVAAVMQAGPQMSLVARHGELRDEDLLLEWANDPVTRANGYNPNPIARDDHVRWYRGRLRNPVGCRLFIIETPSGIPVGQVRFDQRDGEWEISYAVAPVFRGRGIGRSMLNVAFAGLDRAADTIIAQVKPDNAASRRIFETLGFSLRSADAERLVFERHSQN